MSLAYCMSKKVASLNKKNRKAKKIETVVVFRKYLKEKKKDERENG